MHAKEEDKSFLIFALVFPVSRFCGAALALDCRMQIEFECGDSQRTLLSSKALNTPLTSISEPCRGSCNMGHYVWP